LARKVRRRAASLCSVSACMESLARVPAGCCPDRDLPDPAFESAQIRLAFTIGNMGPRSADIGLRVQFRAGALNLMNQPRFSKPTTSVTSGSFGIVSSQANMPRQVQFGVKVLW
jgi:hypothetical protein